MRFLGYAALRNSDVSHAAIYHQDIIDKLVRTAEIWMDSKDIGQVDVYTARDGVFEPRQNDPLSFRYRPSADASHNAPSQAAANMGERQYAHWGGRLEGSGENATWLIDTLHRAPGVAGKISRKKGY